MDKYPERHSHFAHKLVRLMLHSCATQDIGTDGFALVVAIAHAEDAKRYSGPVTYWNEQLMPIIGFQSWGQLDRARKKAIAAGWLHYECGGKGRVGKYWCVVPGHLTEAPDGSTESDHHVSLSKNGEPNGKETGKKREPNVNQTWEKRGRSGEHSTLSLSLPLKEAVTETETETETESQPGRTKNPGTHEPPDINALRCVPITAIPIGRVNPSAVFDVLTPEMLANPSQVISWFRRQLNAASPVLEGNYADLLLAVCASRRASGRGIKQPVGSFVSLVTKRNWRGVIRYRKEAEAAIAAVLESDLPTKPSETGCAT